VDNFHAQYATEALGISVGAAALAAPFWYRLLDQVGSLRNTGRAHPNPAASTPRCNSSNRGGSANMCFYFMR
jgi:hypothetical protein